MQLIQNDIETYSAANSILEQDFEFEINKKNQSSKEIGQIINSINNIFLQVFESFNTFVWLFWKLS